MTHVEAVLAIAQIQRQHALGFGHQDALVTLNAFFFSVYLVTLQKTHRAWRSDLSRYNTHLRETIGELLVSQITPAVLFRVVEGLQRSPKSYRGQGALSDASVNRVIALLKAIFAKLVLSGYIESNPASALKLRRERNQRTRVLREEEYDAFFMALAVAPIKVKLLVQLLLLTGMRLSEALTLRWSYVDIPHRSLHLPDSKAGVPRDVPLSDEAVLVLQGCRALGRHDWVFPGRGGQHLSRPGRQFRALTAAAGVDGLWLHDLRRTYGTAAAQQVPIQDVSRCLGHSSISVTERYVVSSDARLQATAAAVGRHLSLVLAPVAPSRTPPIVGEEGDMA